MPASDSGRSGWTAGHPAPPSRLLLDCQHRIERWPHRKQLFNRGPGMPWSQTRLSAIATCHVQSREPRDEPAMLGLYVGGLFLWNAGLWVSLGPQVTTPYPRGCSGLGQLRGTVGDGDGGWTGDQCSKGLGRTVGEEIDTNREADRQPRHEACRAGTRYCLCAPPGPCPTPIPRTQSGSQPSWGPTWHLPLQLSGGWGRAMMAAWWMYSSFTPRGTVLFKKSLGVTRGHIATGGPRPRDLEWQAAPTIHRSPNIHWRHCRSSQWF